MYVYGLLRGYLKHKRFHIILVITWYPSFKFIINYIVEIYICNFILVNGSCIRNWIFSCFGKTNIQAGGVSRIWDKMEHQKCFMPHLTRIIFRLVKTLPPISQHQNGRNQEEDGEALQWDIRGRGMKCLCWRNIF